MNRLVAVSLFTAAVAASACTATESPTSPDAATRTVIGQGASLANTSTCPKPTPRASRPIQLKAIPHDPVPWSIIGVPPTVNVLFTNATCETLQMIWVRATGVQEPYGTLEPGGTNQQATYIGHVWLFKRTDGTVYAAFRIEDYPSGDQEVFLGCTKGKNAFCN